MLSKTYFDLSQYWSKQNHSKSETRFEDIHSKSLMRKNKITGYSPFCDNASSGTFSRISTVTFYRLFRLGRVIAPQGWAIGPAGA